jgi:hypothetical protein
MSSELRSPSPCFRTLFNYGLVVEKAGESVHKGIPSSTGFFQRRMPETGILHISIGQAKWSSNRPGDVEFDLSVTNFSTNIRYKH